MAAIVTAQAPEAATRPDKPPRRGVPYTGAVSAVSAPLHQLLTRAAEAVQAVRQGHSLTEALARCPAAQRPGAQALSFHTLRRLGGVEAARQQLAPRRPAPAVENLLLVALALLWPDADPMYAAHVVVDEAVRAVRKRDQKGGGFVNAVLRRFLRERDAVVAAARAAPRGRYNHPDWWIDRLRADWPEHWEALLAANDAHPPMTLRARDGAAACVAALAAEGLAAHAVSAQAVVLERPAPVQALPGFAQGRVSVQDAAAQIAAPLLLLEPGGAVRPRAADGAAARLAPGPLRPGARVLDACAAPGGKTAHLLELRPDLELHALDADAQRLERVRDNLARLGLSAQLRAADARQVADWNPAGLRFDAILLDAPCSAAGIVRRHPDARWLRRAEDIAALARIQAELLDALWPLLLPGGRLVYATCSVFKAEGVHQIDAFLQRHPEALQIDAAGFTGHLLPLPDNDSQVPAAGGPPRPSAFDGFFYALLAKPA